ncbi:hypothetical protein, partial [Sphingobacterium faecium]|uniref:hypothetical protein n=1 Tax=Sphingobacterium faecium TaxID=34087 RepID=UPI0018851879
KTIEEKNNSGIQKIQKDIAVIKKEQDVIKLWDLKQIFEKVDLNQYLEDFSNNMLLKNLILNGYINENYNDYISLFHEGSITKEDLSYERNVKSANPTDFDYKLHKIKGVLDRIDLRYFSKESILNFDMVNFLGNNYQNHSSYYNQIIELLSNNRERSIKFIDEYITDGERPIDIFIKKLTKQWTNFFNYVTEESNYQGDKIHNYLRLILTHADLEDILNQNHAPLVEMITYNQSFLSLVNTKNRKDLESKIQAVISKLDIKFSTLDNPIPETKILFDFIYQNNHYRVNKENILQMLVFNTEVFDKTTFETRNYSTIKKSDCKYLIEYIDKNINEYIRDIYLQIETNTKEEEKYLIELFNKKNITTYNSKIISDKMDAIISDVSTINDDDLIFHLLSISKIKASWENLHHIYYGYEETLDLIINFINMSDNAEKLSTAHVPKSKDEKGKMTFIQMWKDILSSPTLPIELFEQILQASDIGIKIFDFEKVEKERLEIMIKGNSFAFENNLFDQLEEYHSLGQLYLDSYKAELLKFIDTFSIDEKHLAQIFDSKNYISNEINIILSEFDITDYKSTAMLLRLKYRLSKESNLNITPQKIIETISVSRSDFFNVKVLVNYFDKFKREEIRDIINNLQDEEYRKILSTYSNESLKLEQTTYNNDLFQLLKDRNYISERSRKTKNGYQIFKNKTTNIL